MDSDMKRRSMPAAQKSCGPVKRWAILSQGVKRVKCVVHQKMEAFAASVKVSNQNSVAATSATARVICKTETQRATAPLVMAAACAGLVVSTLSGSTAVPVTARPADCSAARRVAAAVGSTSELEMTAAAAAFGVATVNWTLSAVVSRWRRPAAWSANETMVTEVVGTFR